jgi:phosphoribosyl 1,2-cyclic phosphodiesterase
VRAAGGIIILDAGTGLRPLGNRLRQEFPSEPLHLTVLLTHTHWDHIQGLPFFSPVYYPENRIRILGYEGARHSLQNVLSSQMESPFFPIHLREVPATVQIEELKEMSFSVGDVQVDAWFANHPGICVGYRLTTHDGSLAFFPDNEPYLSYRRVPGPNAEEESSRLTFAQAQESKLVEFLRGTDVLIMDTQYDCDEYKSHVGWGHGCLDDVVELALKAGIKRLFMFHHDPDHDDAKISEMLEHARRLVAERKATLEVDAAREGDSIHFHKNPSPQSTLAAAPLH